MTPGTILNKIAYFLDMDKTLRQDTILRILEADTISSQKALRKALMVKGFSVTQATLSRDLKELGVIKTVDAAGGYKYAFRENRHSPLFRSCEVSGNLLVVRTDVGMAPVVAYRIDEMALPGVLGTVAGEDTLLAVVADGHDPRQVKRELGARVGSAGRQRNR